MGKDWLDDKHDMIQEMDEAITLIQEMKANIESATKEDDFKDQVNIVVIGTDYQDSEKVLTFFTGGCKIAYLIDFLVGVVKNDPLIHQLVTKGLMEEMFGGIAEGIRSLSVEGSQDQEVAAFLAGKTLN